MLDPSRVCLGLLQQRLRFWDELRLMVLLGDGKRVRCQDHGVVVPTMLAPDPGKRQPRIDRFRGLFQDLL